MQNENSNPCNQILQLSRKREALNTQLKGIIESDKKSARSTKKLLELFVENNVEIDNAKSSPGLYELFLQVQKNELLLAFLKEKPLLGRTGGGASMASFKALW
jgi:hypothetical protein